MSYEDDLLGTCGYPPDDDGASNIEAVCPLCGSYDCRKVWLPKMRCCVCGATFEVQQAKGGNTGEGGGGADGGP